MVSLVRIRVKDHACLTLQSRSPYSHGNSTLSNSLKRSILIPALFKVNWSPVSPVQSGLVWSGLVWSGLVGSGLVYTPLATPQHTGKSNSSSLQLYIITLRQPLYCICITLLPCDSLYTGFTFLPCDSLYIGITLLPCDSLYIGFTFLPCNSLYISFTLLPCNSH